MTNGEKIQAVFPDIEMWGESKDTLDYSLGGMIHRVTKSWWNAECKESVIRDNGIKDELNRVEDELEPTIKNNLGVDCVSRKAVLNTIRDWWKVAMMADGKPTLCDSIRDLPPVTPIRPEGHWILTDVEGNKVWHCNCSKCGKDPLNYIGGSENWWLIKSNLPKFCPNCGSDNREVEK